VLGYIWYQCFQKRQENWNSG